MPFVIPPQFHVSYLDIFYVPPLFHTSAIGHSMLLHPLYISSERLDCSGVRRYSCCRTLMLVALSAEIRLCRLILRALPSTFYTIIATFATICSESITSVSEQFHVPYRDTNFGSLVDKAENRYLHEYGGKIIFSLHWNLACK